MRGHKSLLLELLIEERKRLLDQISKMKIEAQELRDKLDPVGAQVRKKCEDLKESVASTLYGYSNIGVTENE